MRKMPKVLSISLVLSLLIAVFQVVPAFAAREVRVEVKEVAGASITIANVVDKDDEKPFYVANAPATVIFNGTGLGCEKIMFAEGQRKDGTIYLDTSEEPIKFNVKKYTDGSAQVFDEVTDNSVDTPKYVAGNNATLTEPGFYFVTAGPHCTFSYTTELVIYVVEGKGDGTVPAKPVSAKLSVNGADVTFGAYNIHGEYVFKVRDIAKVISGTPKQFAVTWDAEKNAIDLIRGEAYTPVGGELAVLADKETQAAMPAAVKVYVDGAESELKAYKIGGSNYFKLSQLSKVFDFAVTYDEETGGKRIRTDLTYWDSY